MEITVNIVSNVSTSNLTVVMGFMNIGETVVFFFVTFPTMDI